MVTIARTCCRCSAHTQRGSGRIAPEADGAAVRAAFARPRQSESHLTWGSKDEPGGRVSLFHVVVTAGRVALTWMDRDSVA